MNMKIIPYKQLLLIPLCLFPLMAISSDIDLANEPLAIKTRGAAPNVMLLFDDSTSMTCHFYDKSCGDDIAYSPGYDSEKEYRCSDTTPVLEPVSGQAVVVHISNNSGYEGTPYFSYNGIDYGWGTLSGSGIYSTPEIYSSQTQTRVCFDPDKTYSVRLKADRKAPSPKVYKYEPYCASSTAPYGIHPTDTPVFYATIKVVSKNTYTNVWVCNGTATDTTKRYFATRATADNWAGASSTINYFYSDSLERTETGNYLNWYFSATLAEWADASADGGFNDYGTSAPNKGHWTEEVASDFIIQYTSYLGADPASTSINGTTKNSSGKTWFPNDKPPGANNEWSLHTSSTHQDGTHDLIGFKPAVSDNQMRYMVAKDVAKMLMRKLDNAFFGVAAMHTPVAKDFSVPSDATMWQTGSGSLYATDGASIVHGLVEIDNTTTDSAVQQTTAERKVSLARSIDAIRSTGSTPTSEAMAAVASYLFQTFETESSPIGASGQTLAGSLPSTLIHHSNSPGVDRTVPNITDDNWCAKNVTVVLTDGEPTNDISYPSDFRTLYPSGLPNPSTPPVPVYSSSDAYNKSGIVRVAGGLYDFDWLPNIQGKQNIETFFIAMGDSNTVNQPIFDLAGMAGGGGTNNSFAASSGTDIVNAFNAIIEKVNSSSASVTSVAISTVSELKTDSVAFQATYDTEFWTSSIKAIKINTDGYFVNPDGSGAAENSSGITAVWEANAVLNSMYLINDSNSSYMTNGAKSRRVFTWKTDTGVQFGSSAMTRPASPGATFAAFDNLPLGIKIDLDVVANGNSQERYDLMMYLLGDATNEVGYPVAGTAKYRQRGSYLDSDSDGLIDSVSKGGLLGDIVHSSPVYVQKPPRPWDDGNYGIAGKRYSDYKKQQASRDAMVYAGANDGMVHAFTVAGGTSLAKNYPAGGELFAYMPSMLASTVKNAGFHYLSDKTYQHRFYVDLTLTPSDVFMDFYSGSSGPMLPEWRTILVGGLRAGGKGLFAIDVTCPFQTSSAGNTCDNESFNASNVLWEFDVSDDTDLGFGYSEPVIAKVNYDSGMASGEERNGNGNGRWAAIVGNGYNSANGRAVLYILFLDGGLDGSWTEGVDYLKIYVSDASTDKVSSKNGLSSPQAVDINRDGLVDRIYAGDLKGQMWSIDVASAFSKTDFDSGYTRWVANKLFTTGIEDGKVQPITTPPMVARDGSISAPSPNLMVIFATGKYLEEGDLHDKSLQSVYGIHDRGDFELTRYGETADGSKTLLEPRFFTEYPLTVGTRSIINRKLSGNNVDPDSQYGWYADLASDLDKDEQISGSEIKGERVAFSPFLANKLFVFNTIIPVVASCSGATEGWTMLIDWTTGLAPSFETYDANLSGAIDGADMGFIGFFNSAAGSQLGRGGDNLYDSMGNDARRMQVDFGSLGAGKRLGWEERFPFGVIK